MKNYTITVNGTAYDVTVEEGSGSGAPAAAKPASTAQSAVAPKKAPASTAQSAVAKSAGGQGATKVNAPMPGKILSVKTSAGQAVKKGDVLMILEAMKMENEVVAPSDGTVASIDVTEGSSVEAGAVLATLD